MVEIERSRTLKLSVPPRCKNQLILWGNTLASTPEIDNPANKIDKYDKNPIITKTSGLVM